MKKIARFLYSVAGNKVLNYKTGMKCNCTNCGGTGWKIYRNYYIDIPRWSGPKFYKAPCSDCSHSQFLHYVHLHFPGVDMWSHCRQIDFSGVLEVPISV